MAKIAFLTGQRIGPRPLLHSVAESETLDGVIILARRDGCWSTCWSSGIDMGSLCMATMKLDHDAKAFMHGATYFSTLPDERA